MCTATFVPLADKVIFTSNRDEKPTRRPSSRLQILRKGDKTLLCPVDADAGGTWIAASDQGIVWCLLNGAFKKHISNPPYKRSRGLLLLDAAFDTTSDDWMNQNNLSGIEPFTIIRINIFNEKKFTVFRWDGSELHRAPVSPREAQIWSSATLYNPISVKLRTESWENFLHTHKTQTAQEIWNFHTSNNQSGAPGLLLNSDTHQTVSVCQLLISKHGLSWKYHEMKQDIMENHEFEFCKSDAKKYV
jgi:hypothetical protein